MHALSQSRFRQTIVALCALFLLGAQQAAFVHLLGHSGFAAKTSATPGSKENHGSAAGLSHACTTCLAFTALASAAPLPSHQSAIPSAWAATKAPAKQLRASIHQHLSYAARAPPVLL